MRRRLLLAGLLSLTVLVSAGCAPAAADPATPVLTSDNGQGANLGPADGSDDTDAVTAGSPTDGAGCDQADPDDAADESDTADSDDATADGTADGDQNGSQDDDEADAGGDGGAADCDGGYYPGSRPRRPGMFPRSGIRRSKTSGGKASKSGFSSRSSTSRSGSSGRGGRR